MWYVAQEKTAPFAYPKPPQAGTIQHSALDLLYAEPVSQRLAQRELASRQVAAGTGRPQMIFEAV
jgi:hypothetical protein